MKQYLSRTTQATLATGSFLLLLLWLTDEPTVLATVSPVQVGLGQPIRFTDSTRSAENYRWEFGDGGIARRARGAYTYRQAGVYLVRLTIDEKYQRTFRVTVRPGAPVNLRDSVVQVYGPSTGFQGEQLTFVAAGGPARSFAWRFGETGRVDSRDQTAIYSFSRPGRYTVLLTTDVTKYPLKQSIVIRPGYRRFDPPVDSTDLAGDDIRRRLQSIANGESFNRHYYYVLNKYLCNRHYAAVQINTSKLNDFYSYCMGLRFDRGVQIDGVAINADTVSRCVTRLNVSQHKL